MHAEETSRPAEGVLASETHSAFAARGLRGADYIGVVHRALLLASPITHVADYLIIQICRALLIRSALSASEVFGITLREQGISARAVIFACFTPTSDTSPAALGSR